MQRSKAAFVLVTGVPPKILKGRLTMLLLIIILLVLFAGGGGYYGYNRWGSRGGAGIGLGTVLVILLIAYMLGIFH
jgi:hypothetical protein